MEYLVKMQFGSFVYGTNTPNSDLDFKAVAIPDKKDILLQRAFKSITKSTGTDFSKNTKDDIDDETFSLHYFLKLLIEGQTVCLDMLFTPETFYQKNSDIWRELKKNKNELISKEMSAFAGYCQSQAAKYSLKGSNLAAYETAMNFFSIQNKNKKVGDTPIDMLVGALTGEKIKALNGKESPSAQVVEIPNNKGILEKYIQIGPKTKVPFAARCGLAHEIFKMQYDRYGERAKMAKTNKGIDWKAIMHAIRVCNEAIELCKDHTITFPRPEKDYLLKVRNGEISYEETAEKIEEGLVTLSEVKEKSTLRQKANTQFIEDFICWYYG